MPSFQISDKRLPSTISKEFLGSNLKQFSTAFHKKEKHNEKKIFILKLELETTRKLAIQAMNKGDFRLQAKLTSKAFNINKQILDYQIGIYDNFIEN